MGETPIAQRLVEKTALAPLNPLPACGEGRRSVALAGWGSSGLISNQANMILFKCLQSTLIYYAWLHVDNFPNVAI